MRSGKDFIYEPSQASHIVPYIPPQAEWLVIGGPADANEAQYLHERFPSLQIVGYEPNPTMFKIQSDREFPGQLYPIALWSAPGTMDLRFDHEQRNQRQIHRSSSLLKYQHLSNTIPVPTDTLSNLSLRHGPFCNAVVWLDIEGAEWDCLCGARDLLDRGDILLFNLEMHAYDAPKIDGYLSQYGLREVYRWGQQTLGSGPIWNSVYTL